MKTKEQILEECDKHHIFSKTYKELALLAMTELELQLKDSNIDNYQSLVTKVKKYPPGQEDLYLLGKLTEECGEIGKEIIRKIDGKESQKDLTSEIGDLFWVLTAIAEQNGIKMSEVIEVNLEKLNQRNLL